MLVWDGCVVRMGGCENIFLSTLWGDRELTNARGEARRGGVCVCVAVCVCIWHMVLTLNILRHVVFVLFVVVNSIRIVIPPSVPSIGLKESLCWTRPSHSRLTGEEDCWPTQSCPMTGARYAHKSTRRGRRQKGGKK